MASPLPEFIARELIQGMPPATDWPLSFRAILGDLPPRFLSKGQVGRGFRAVSRNGRVLLASDVALSELTGRSCIVRVQTWHRVILPGENAEPFGLLVCARSGEVDHRAYTARLVPAAAERRGWGIDVGGRMVLEFTADRSE